MVDAALAGFCRTEDASDLVRLLRLVKSPAELRYVRQAGRLADEALAVANRMTVPGQPVHRIYAEMLHGIVAGDGDPSASRWPMGSGTEALLVRYHTGHGKVRARDQVTFEFAASYRHYHAALMNVVLTGRVDRRHEAMYKACRGPSRSARRRCVPARRWATSSPRTPASSRVRDTRVTSSTPAATPWARPIRRPGWTSP